VWRRRQLRNRQLPLPAPKRAAMRATYAS
jgi:hypothetical protein